MDARASSGTASLIRPLLTQGPPSPARARRVGVSSRGEPNLTFSFTTLPSMSLPRGAVWLVVDGSAALEAAYPLIDAALAGRPGVGLVLAVPATDAAAVRRRLSHETVVAFPAGRSSARRLRAAAPALVIALGDAALPAGVPAHRIGSAGEIASLRNLLPTEGPPAEPPSRWQRWLVRLAAGPAIANLGTLRQRLGAPETILCLGNGPSSEDAGVADFADACLFRVNWTWRSRGLLARPTWSSPPTRTCHPQAPAPSWSCRAARRASGCSCATASACGRPHPGICSSTRPRRSRRRSAGSRSPPTAP